MSQGSFLERFFRFLGRSIDALRVFFGRLIFVLILVLVLTAIFSSPETVQIEDGSLVVLAPTGAIVEEPAMIDPANLLLGSDEVIDTPLRDVLRTLELAQEDDKVRGVVLDLEELASISPANMERIGRALDDYKRSGKALVAHGEFFSQAQYYLASFADTVTLHPMGQLMLPGYGGNQLYFAELLDKLGVNVHIFRVGTHKAAVEPYSLNGMSEPSRENNQQVVDALWLRYLSQVANNRHLTVEQVRGYAENYPSLLVAASGNTAQVAIDHQLVDDLATPAQWRATLASLSGASSPRTVDFRRYLMAHQLIEFSTDPEVGVIVAQGTINTGEQPRGSIGSDTLVELIRQARRDDDVRAVVLRIDSPGGSAFASELIRQELQELQAAGKPLVVSMGGTAASGGYWIAAGANEIWASPATVTGSIGIFSIIPTFEKGMAKIGVYADGVGTTPLSRADVMTELSEPMQTVLQTSIEEQYRRFLQLVADGRGMSVDAVDVVAQGQVWTGTQAMERGLVDHLGDLDAAIDAAAELAELERYSTRYIQKPLSPGEQLLSQILQNYGVASLAKSLATAMMPTSTVRLPDNPVTGLLGDAMARVLPLANLRDPGHLYTVCEFCVLMR
ncbi:MAG: signal peptide peptidase SppA [Pseudomonadales bacterium]|nr:signal peptide peptidase SppA [Pseudomonadales bacterium]